MHYLVTLIKKNDESLLKFKEELPSIDLAEKVALDTVRSEMKDFDNEFKETSKTIENMIDDLRKSGKLESLLEDSDDISDGGNESKDNVESPNTADKQTKDEIEGDEDDIGEISSNDAGEETNSQTTVNNENGTIDSQIVATELSSLNKENEDSEGKGIKNAKHPMEKFMTRAQASIKSAFERIEEASKRFSSVLKYFGEDEKMTSADFFGTIKKFIGQFDATLELVNRLDAIKVRKLNPFSYQK